MRVLPAPTPDTATMPIRSPPASPSRGARISPTAVGAFALLLWATLPLLTAQARRLPPFELLALSFGVAFLLAYLWPLPMVLFSALGPGGSLGMRQIAGAMPGFLGTLLIVGGAALAMTAGRPASAVRPG